MPDVIELEFNQKIDRTDLIKSFRFYPKKALSFQPGQFARILFNQNNLSDQELNKYLSFSSSPDKPYLEFTKKISQSFFSQKLDSLAKGDSVFIQAPLGNCVFRKEYKKIAFLIGGIGITPVISILSYIGEKGLDSQAVLFYSNKDENQIAFRKELNRWQKDYPNIRVIYAVTSPLLKNKNFFQGRINQEMVARELKDFRERVFFIFGPPKMVEAMSRLCDEIGCSKEKIKKENFVGY